MTLKLNVTDAGFERAFQTFLGTKRETDRDVNDLVSGVLEDVRSRGDAALLDYTRRFDHFNATAADLQVSSEEIADARDACDATTLSALDVAAERILRFHEFQRPNDIDFTDDEGLRLGYRWGAVGGAGLYVPGGTAAYPSSVLMNAIPAKVAGVERLVMVVPTPNGKINPLVFAAAELAGVDEIYRIGGAQAIAALAFGTATVKPVDKIVGPGNAYVAAAKRQVFGTVGIDMIAGPSEILVLADDQNEPDWIAADLLSQAEHDTAAQSILITNNEVFADAVAEAIGRYLKTLPRSDIANASWGDHGAIFIVPSLEDSLPLIDQIAPEHLEIACSNARKYAERVRNAGAIFIGRFAPEAVGDYLAGPNHVLPTARSARFSSGLGVLDFMKRTSLIECSADSLAIIGPSAIKLARAEGLNAHALAVSIRLNTPSDD
ncbi:MAG: histidinol dehydrogenase [Rhodospirillaceae bacterium TMED8]|nr:histidinol dehydrogenase [Magnetovibrio sp.]OUT48135.1 MAG: histidinol dehydrogenase [Rhodospirillaceae bacterium TMED8]|tara:strand:+ start:213 stop:1517 length:1305 start_codon:yes stop_codon:yes gene_type:complete